MSKVLTVGTFDLYHQGHTNLLYQCAKIAGVIQRSQSGFTMPDADGYHVTVGLNSDEFVKKYKGRKPIYTYKERYDLLINNRYVFNVERNNSTTLESLLKSDKPDFLVIGSDWATKDYYAQIGVDQSWLDKHEVTLCYVPYTKGISTTQLKERIRVS